MSLIYPGRCVFCGQVIPDKNVVCKECASKIKVIGDNICDRCGKDKEQCICKVGDFAFDRNIAYFYYDGPVRHAVARFKFRKSPQLSHVLAKYMFKAICDKYNDFTFDFVTYVPSNIVKLLKRTYCPTGLLANEISKFMNLQAKDTLNMKLFSFSQKYVKYKDRRKNVRGNFRVKNDVVKNKNILLVDDVMTSGSTLSECARVLKKAGAKTVCCVTLAITLKK